MAGEKEVDIACSVSTLPVAVGVICAEIPSLIPAHGGDCRRLPERPIAVSSAGTAHSKATEPESVPAPPRVVYRMLLQKRRTPLPQALTTSKGHSLVEESGRRLFRFPRMK